MSYKVPEDCKYTKQHEWARVEGSELVIGITDYAQSSLGDIVFVDLKEADTELEAEDSFGAIESVKAAEDLYAPVKGTIAALNDSIKDAPESINTDAYAAWLVKLKDFDAGALDQLMDAAAYTELLSTLE